jgi:hypothetical protein
MLAGEFAPTLVAVFTGAAIYRPAGSSRLRGSIPAYMGPSTYIGHLLDTLSQDPLISLFYMASPTGFEPVLPP